MQLFKKPPLADKKVHSFLMPQHVRFDEITSRQNSSERVRITCSWCQVKNSATDTPQRDWQPLAHQSLALISLSSLMSWLYGQISFFGKAVCTVGDIEGHRVLAVIFLYFTYPRLRQKIALVPTFAQSSFCRTR